MARMLPTNRRLSFGVTIIELTVVITILPIIIALFIYAVFASVNASTKSKAQLELDTGVRDAMNVIERDVRYSVAFDKTVPAEYSDPYGPNNSGTNGAEAWNFTGVPAASSDRILILSVPATTQAGVSNAREPVYVDGSYNCSTERTYNPEHTYITIYFVRGGTLYRRILTDTTTTVCNGPQNQKQSCPADIYPWNVICEAKDEVIATNVSSFSIDYYVNQVATPISNVYTSSDPDILNTADDAEVTLTLSRQFAGETISGTSTLRIAKVNK